jgi:hypothetical protein
MFFFCKPSKVLVDCFTSDVSAHTLYPIDYSHKYFPDWWKQLSNRDEHNGTYTDIQIPTIKRCQGILDLYKEGFILPLWSDVVFEPRGIEGYAFQFADRKSQIMVHPEVQYGSFFKNYYHGKIFSPWSLIEKTGLKFKVSSCTWSLLNLTNDFNLLDGILDFKYQNGTNINFFLNNNIKNQVLLEAGTPMLHIVPLTEKRLEIKRHLIDDAEYIKMFALNNATPKFSGNYTEKKKVNAKCPFA